MCSCPRRPGAAARRRICTCSDAPSSSSTPRPSTSPSPTSNSHTRAGSHSAGILQVFGCSDSADSGVPRVKLRTPIAPTAIEALWFGPSARCWVRHPARTSARNVGSETRLVVGEGLVDNRVVGPEPTLGSAPEPDEGDYSLVVRLATSDGGERSSIAACRYAQPTGGRLDRRAC